MARPTTALDNERRPAHELSVLINVGCSDHREVSVEHREVEIPSRSSRSPLADGLSRDAVLSGDVLTRTSFVNLAECREDVIDGVDFARERIARQHTLARSTRVTSRQAHRHFAVAAACLEPAVDPGVRQPQIRTAARRADAPIQNRIIGSRQRLGVSCRLYCKYVYHHVPRRLRRLHRDQLCRGRHFLYRTRSGIACFGRG